MSVEADHRLPRTVLPTRYDLRIEADLDASTFSGRVVIEAEVTEETDIVVLNALELEFSSVTVTQGAVSQLPTVDVDTARQRATFSLASSLVPGPVAIDIEYTGTIGEVLVGFYRSRYVDANGDDRVLASTQLESTHARMAFPCWDEPDLKAVFGVTIVVGEGLVAFSNMSETSRVGLPDGRTQFTFADTPVMSTYPLAWVVGDLVATEPVDVDGVPLRIVTPRGKEHLTGYALEAGAFAVRYFVDYYDIPYPGDKLDMVAIPDFAWGAMENLGCITYRESALLIDEDSATQLELQRVASIIAHEIAHMWFGDLVTMKWWNGVWLNEAFATFAETKCTAAFRPEWNYWLPFSSDRAASQETDALHTTRSIEFPVASPEEADEMFDVLTYEKGASVLRMMEQYLGEDAFRAGVSRYLKTHAYGNTENSDLWAALEEASGEPVGEIMDTWIFQGGYPAIDVVRHGDTVTLTQRHFRYLGEGDTSWLVPVLYRDDRGTHRVLVGEESVTIDVEGSLVVNAGGEGFYRTVYDETAYAALRDSFPELDPIERFGVLSDAKAALLKGSIDVADYIGLLGAVKEEREKDVWAVALAGLGEIDRVTSSDDEAALQGFVAGLVGGVVDELGWMTSDDDSEATRALRSLALKALGNLADDARTIEIAREVALGDPGCAEVADAALAIAAAHGTIDDFDRFIALSGQAPTPQLTVKYLRAAATVPDPEVPGRVVDMVLRKEIRSQDSFWVLALLLGHKTNGARAWQLITDNWDEVIASMPPASQHRILDFVQHRTEPEVAASIRAWLADHPIPSAEKATAQRMEMLDVRLGLRARIGDHVGEAVTLD